VDKHTESRLKRENVIWLVTAGRDARPQAVPVWYIYQHEPSSFLIYAQDGVKVRHVRENPYVELHLNTDEAGEDVVRASGYATMPKSEPPAHKSPTYLRKYRSQIIGIGMTVEQFAEKYPNAIRVRRLRFH
jgi:PPOX class probable F420-dependent enzyme